MMEKQKGDCTQGACNTAGGGGNGEVQEAGDAAASSQVEWDLVSEHFLEEVSEPDVQGQEGNRVTEKGEHSSV